MMMHRISWSRNKVERKREGAKENKDKQIRKEEMICVTIEFCSSSLLLCQICFRKRSATGLVVQHSLLVITMMRIKANVNPWSKSLRTETSQKELKSITRLQVNVYILPIEYLFIYSSSFSYLLWPIILYFFRLLKYHTIFF